MSKHTGIIPCLLISLLIQGLLIQAQAATLLAAQPENNLESGLENNLKNNLQVFLAWFEGEYDNYEQVWRQRNDNEENVLEHIHHIFKPVEYPALGEHVFFVKQYMDGDVDKVYRQRLYSFAVNEEEGAIQLTIYSFKDEDRYRQTDQNPALLEGLARADLKTISGCEVFWRWNGEYFDGYMKKDACTFVSSRSGKRIFINDTLRLTESFLWIQDQAHDAEGRRIFGHDMPHKNRKVRFYKGWMALREYKLNATADPADWVFMTIARMHNEGQRTPLVDKTGQPSGYSLTLETLTYQNTGVPILKLGVIEDKTGATLSYAWAEPAAGRIGINLGWFQAGLTRLDE